VEIRWPGGATESVAVPVNQISYVQEGKGVVPPWGKKVARGSQRGK
jgi:hypothetical protein